MLTAHLWPSLAFAIATASSSRSGSCPPLSLLPRPCGLPGSSTLCQPEDNAGRLASGETRERSFPPRAEAERSPSCGRHRVIWGHRSCVALLPVTGVTLKLRDSRLQRAHITHLFPSSELLGPLYFPPLGRSSVSPSKREMPFSLKCLNPRDTFWRGCFLCLGLWRCGPRCRPNRAALARAHQGGGQLRMGLAHLGALCPSGVWPPPHGCSGQGQRLSSPGAAQQPLFHPWPRASFVQGEEGILHAAVTHSQLERSNGTASPSMSSWPGWDTARQLAPMAALRFPHGHASSIPPKSTAEQGCSPGPESMQQPAALPCWHCHVHPFHLHTLVSIHGAPQLMPARVHGGTPALLLSSAPGSPMKH